MTERVHPSTQPILQQSSNGSGSFNGGNTTGETQYVPPPKPQIHPNNRPINQRPYRSRQPSPPPSRRCCSPRKCCCLCIIYTLLIFLIIILIAGIAATIFYFIYHPKPPSFTITSAKISTFNLTSNPDGVFSHLDSHIDFTLSTKNPNDKLKFTYSNLLLTATASGTAYAGTADIPGFLHLPGNTTMIQAGVVGDPTKDLDSDSVSQLKTDLGSKSGAFPLSLRMDTKVRVKFGNLQSNRIGLRVVCVGMKGTVPTTKSVNSTKKGVKPVMKIVPSVVVISDAKCKVDFRIKIWRFTF